MRRKAGPIPACLIARKPHLVMCIPEAARAWARPGATDSGMGRDAGYVLQPRQTDAKAARKPACKALKCLPIQHETKQRKCHLRLMLLPMY